MSLPTTNNQPKQNYPEFLQLVVVFLSMTTKLVPVFGESLKEH
jgi:hypothetical protein